MKMKVFGYLHRGKERYEYMSLVTGEVNSKEDAVGFD